MLHAISLAHAVNAHLFFRADARILTDDFKVVNTEHATHSLPHIRKGRVVDDGFARRMLNSNDSHVRVTKKNVG